MSVQSSIILAILAFVKYLSKHYRSPYLNKRDITLNSGVPATFIRSKSTVSVLVTTAEQMGIPVIVTEQYPQGLGGTVKEIQDNIKEYQYVEKMDFSAFEGLNHLLSTMGRKTLLVTGSETHVCVFQSTRDLVAAGYRVQVVKDAVCSRFKANYLNGLELMQGVGAVVTNTETVLFDLMKVAGTPEFKVISRLLR